MTKQRRLLRLKQIIGDQTATPPIVGIIPVSKSAWYDGIEKGLYPASVKIPGCTSAFWFEDEVNAVVERAEVVNG